MADLLILEDKAPRYRPPRFAGEPGERHSKKLAAGFRHYARIAVRLRPSASAILPKPKR
jgi:hypothetical protein